MMRYKSWSRHQVTGFLVRKRIRTCFKSVVKRYMNGFKPIKKFGTGPETRLVLIALGSFARRSVQYANGRWHLFGYRKLRRELKSRRVVLYSYDKYEDSYFVKFEDGLMLWSSVPSNLHRLLLNSRVSIDITSGTIVCVLERTILRSRWSLC